MRAYQMSALLIFVCESAAAQTGNSFVTSDGLNRAPAVALHCVGQGNVAVPCGASNQPVYVSAVPANGVLLSRTAVVPATQSTQLFPANAARHSLAFQAPAGSSVWINFLGGPATPNGADCVQLSAGTFYESGQYVTRGAVTIYSPVGATIAAWEG